MKKSILIFICTVSYIYSCLFNFLKIFCTLLFPFTRGATLNFSIISPIILLIVDQNQINVVVRWVCLVTIAFIWLAIILFTILCFIKKTRIILNILSVSAALFDCLIPMIFSTSQAKIVYLLGSSIIIFVNVISIVFSIWLTKSKTMES